MNHLLKIVTLAAALAAATAFAGHGTPPSQDLAKTDPSAIEDLRRILSEARR